MITKIEGWLNNRLIAFIIYILFFLVMVFVSPSDSYSIVDMLILSIYSILVVSIQSRTRAIKNKRLWFVGMLIYSPIVFPIFLLHDKKYFGKLILLCGINIAIFSIAAYLWAQSLTIYDSFNGWDAGDYELSQIHNQLNNIDFNNMNEESSKYVVTLSENLIEKLSTVSGSIQAIRDDVLIKSSPEHSEYYKKWSEQYEQQIRASKAYIEIYKGMDENRPTKEIDKLSADWKIEDDKVASFDLKALAKKPIIIGSFASINTVSVLVTLTFLLSIINTFVYIKAFGLKTWKLKILFGINVVMMLLLSGSLFLIAP